MFKDSFSVLLIEDSNADFRLIQEYLGESNNPSFRISRSDNFYNGLRLISADRPDLVLLDLSLPDRAGLEALTEIKSKFPHIPVIICSGAEDKEITVNALQIGAQDYVYKGKFDSYSLSRSLIFAYERNRLALELEKRNVFEQESEERYRLFFQYNPHPAFLFDHSNLNVLEVNQAVLEKYGFSESELLGKNILDLFHSDDKNSAEEEIRSFAFGVNKTSSSRHKKKDGSVLLTENTVYKFRFRNQILGLAVVTDVTEAVRNRESILASLEEKDTLIQEIHHRVKNNMQIMVSLLNLQADNAMTRELTSKELYGLLKDTESRVFSMALVHNELYKSRDLSHVEFGGYLNMLLQNLWNLYGVGTNVKHEIQAEELQLDMNTAIPLGLIACELVTNAVKHAFGESGSGRILIRVFRRDDGIRITIEDDGKGISAGWLAEHPDTLGLQLVKILSKQIGGEFELESLRPGTKFCIRFPEPEKKT
ncbi:histidine kinase dimerization/phosphoacceptor domain -containing protein [Leptospira ellisii]|uniref:Histidine kinase dimerization/phosphoacceptor domain -containing protein n=3 Tax=Leptospira ellisii TaxID=2023197 RepID=A0AAE4TY71_9LEPT|nr:histidine kinase dimerization/phosphoacceptor domain -containing protein [Leptospira ellisii]MDV6235267.1 histidine kinase dimerization/phosphoacceptor domain -containing protein [Leptospira ellisii]PKA06073.1 histidine kinase [Leptospira ellisii]